MTFRRLYALLLYLLPAAFRRRFGREMREEAEWVLRHGGREGRAGLMVDLARTWVREWMDEAGAALRALSGGMGMGMGSFRTSLRGLVRTPGFTVAVVVTLGLGIGANTFAFGLVDAFLLRTLPYDQPDELVAIWPDQLFSREMVRSAQEELSGLQDAAGVSAALLTLQEGGDPVEVFAQEHTTNLFGLLGARPLLGRDFTPADAEAGAEPVTILTHELWTARFGADPEVLGRVIELGGEGHVRRRVIGVMPSDHAPIRGSRVEAWTPVTLDPADPDWDDSYFMTGLGRLRPGQTVAGFQPEQKAWAQRLAEGSDWFADEEVARARPVGWAELGVADRRPPLLMALAAAALILLVACANVANLVLARTIGREREFSVRAALGSGRSRAAGLVFSETLLLGLAGSLLGVGVALLLENRVAVIAPDLVPESGLDVLGRPLIVAAGLAVLTALLAGIGPALHSAGRDPAEAMSGGRGAQLSRGTRRLQSTLAAGQLGLATVGIVATLLLARSLASLAAVDPGFEAGEQLTFRVTAPAFSHPEDEDVERFFREATVALQETPGVRNAGFVSRRPMMGGLSRITAFPEGWEVAEGDRPPEVTHRLVTPGYLEAIGMRLLDGSYLGPEHDVEGAADFGVVTRTAAERFWPGESAVGKSFLAPGGVPWLTIVGVVEDVREQGPAVELLPAAYIMHRNWPWRTMFAVVEAEGGTLPIGEAEAAIRSVQAGVPVARVSTVSTFVENALRPTRLLVYLALVAGSVTLLLGALGVYGVVAYGVSRRTRELGVRAALGAGATRILRSELGRVGPILAMGGVVGVVGAWFAGRGLESTLFGVDAFEPISVGAAVLLLAAVAITAAWIPARRAARVDPVEALRSE